MLGKERRKADGDLLTYLAWFIIGTLIATWAIPNSVHWLVVSLVGGAGGGLLLLAALYKARHHSTGGPAPAETLRLSGRAFVGFSALGLVAANCAPLFSIEEPFTLVMPWFLLVGIFSGLLWEAAAAKVGSVEVMPRWFSLGAIVTLFCVGLSALTFGYALEGPMGEASFAVGSIGGLLLAVVITAVVVSKS